MSETPAPRYYRADKQRYDASSQPTRAHIGVPLRDLTAEEVAALPAWQLAEIDASDLYQKTKPRDPDAPRVPRRESETEE